jgi:dolichol-phosphate mannosyltransferase
MLNRSLQGSANDQTLELTPAGAPVLSLVLPTYNEFENLERALGLIQDALQRGDCNSFEIIVVDDDSPDGTGALAEELAAENNRIRVVRRKNERGLASAVLAGFRAARGQILAVMDADLQHPPDIVPRLLRAIQARADIAVASRYAQGGDIPSWSFLRRWVSRSSTLITRLVLPGTVSGVSDPLSGCFAVRREVIEGADLSPIGFRMLLEVLGAGQYQLVCDVPYSFAERTAGTSKLGLKIAFQDAAQLLRLAWRTGHMERFAKFAIVGLSGVAANVALLTIFRHFTPLPLASCGALAVIGSIGSNFALNESWTFADWARARGGFVNRLGRLARYALVCTGGGTVNVITLVVLNRWAGLYYLLSDMVGIGLAMTWNYGWNANLTWLPAKNQTVGEGRTREA